MCSFAKLTLLLIVPAAGIWAQPQIGGIVNSASFASAALDSSGNPIGNNNIAQGSIFSVFGLNMGPATLIAPSGLPLPTSLPASNGTSIAITSGGQTVQAFMVYAFAGQLAAILPSNTPIGAATVTVTYNGQTSAPAKINVVASLLGIYTQNSQGNGPGIAQIYRSATDVSLMDLTNSAQNGNTLVLYGTGLGAISGPDNQPPGAVAVGSNVTINVAGVTIPASYAGRSPQFPGLDQINFALPANVATGCYIPAEVTASGVPSSLFYLEIGSNSTTCVHPLGLTASQLGALDQGGTLNIGVLQILQAVVLGTSAGGAGGVFLKANANNVYQAYNLIPNGFGTFAFPVAAGSCAVMDSLNTIGAFTVPNLSQIGGQELLAGGALTAAGTGTGSPQGILHLPTGGYLLPLLNVFGPGPASLTGPGGPDVGPFTASITLPPGTTAAPGLTWTNSGNLSSVPNSTSLTITWAGGDPNALVTISGSSVVINPSDPSKSRGKQFSCNAPGSAGQFVIPASVRAQLPSSTADASAGEVAVAVLGISSGGSAHFSAPLTAGGNVDLGFLGYGEASTQSVKYQ